MGVAPLQFKEGESADYLGLDGSESLTITGLAEDLKPHKMLDVVAKNLETGKETKFQVQARLDSDIEIDYYKNKGIFQYVLRERLKEM